MLEARLDAAPLNGLHFWHDQAHVKQGLFTKGLEGPPGLRSAGDIHRGAQEDVVPRRRRLRTQHVAVLDGEVLTPRRGEGDGRGQGRGRSSVVTGRCPAHSGRTVCEVKRRQPSGTRFGLLADELPTHQFDLVLQAQLAEQHFYLRVHPGRRVPVQVPLGHAGCSIRSCSSLFRSSSRCGMPHTARWMLVPERLLCRDFLNPSRWSAEWA